MEYYMEDKIRMIALRKEDTETNGIVWQIEIDGEWVSMGLTQEFMDNVKAAATNDLIDEAVEGVAFSLAEDKYALTEKEKNQLHKLIQCMT